jgi:hypothetical protein
LVGFEVLDKVIFAPIEAGFGETDIVPVTEFTWALYKS